MKDQRFEEMLRLGMRPQQRLLLMVMRWPEPSVDGFWHDLWLNPRVEQHSLYDVLAEPAKLHGAFERTAEKLGVSVEGLEDAMYAAAWER